MEPLNLRSLSLRLLTRWAIPAAAGLIVAYTCFYLVIRPLPGFPQSMDFTHMWLAGRMWLDGQLGNLYDIPTQMAYQHNYAPDLFKAHSGLLFNRPPAYILPIVPLALLPLVPAYVLWSIILLAESGIALWLIVTRIYPGDPSPPAARKAFAQAAILAFAFYPFFFGQLLGQTTPLELLLLVGFYLLCRAGKESCGGVLLGLAFFVKPQMAIFFVPLLLVRRNWRGLAWLAATGGIGVIVSLLMVGVDGLFSYGRLLEEIYRSYCAYGIYPERYPAWRGLVVGQMVPGCQLAYDLGMSRAALEPALQQAGLVTNILNLITAAVWLAACWRNRKAPADSAHFDLLVAATVVTSLLASPYTNPQDLTRLVLVVPLVYRAHRLRPDLVPAGLVSPLLLALGLILGVIVNGSTLLFSTHPNVLLLAVILAVMLLQLLTQPLDTLRRQPTASARGMITVDVHNDDSLQN